MALDLLHHDLELSWINKKASADDTISSAEEAILTSDSLSAASSPLKTLNSNIQIRLSKLNTSFDFAEHFRELLLNDEWTKKDSIVNLTSIVGKDISKLLYERIQNWLGNIVNIDTCHFNELVSAYASYAIDITKGNYSVPEELEYLINIFSLPKFYYKSFFYDGSFYDLELSKNFNEIKTTEQLKSINDALNRKYFDNFYDNLVYPMVRNELWVNRENEAIAKYIEDSSAGIYDCLITSDPASQYTFLNHIATGLPDDTINALAAKMLDEFLTNNPEFEAVDSITGYTSKYIRNDYFNVILKSGNLSYVEDSYGDLAYLDMSQYINNTPSTYPNINFSKPTYTDVLSMFETLLLTRVEFVEVLKVRLAAKKITNLCNDVCRLRSDIKSIREKDSKVGTAVLIEQLILEFIYRELTKKVSVKQQKKVDSDFADLSNTYEDVDSTSDTGKVLIKNFKNLLSSERQAIGVKFEDQFEKLSQLSKQLELEVVEYYDNTPTYLNIIPETGTITRKQFYKVKAYQCPKYLNVNGEMVYCDFNDTDSIIECDSIKKDSQFTKLLHQCAIGDEASGYTYFFKGNEAEINSKNQMVCNGKVLYAPISSYNYEYATNLNSENIVWNEVYNWYQYKDNSAEDNATIIVDRYDREIKFKRFTRLVDTSGEIIMEWMNEQQSRPSKSYFSKLFFADILGYQDYTSGTYMLVSDEEGEYKKSDHAFDDVEPDPEKDPIILYLGLFVEAKDGMVSEVQESSPSNIWVPILKTSNAEIATIYQNKLSSYIRLMDGSIINSVSSNLKHYGLVYTNEFILDGDTVVYSSGQLLDSEGFVLNNYATDTELFYKSANCKLVFLDKSVDVIRALNGNEPFWNDIAYDIKYSDKTLDEEIQIIKFYKSIGLIDNELTADAKHINYDKSEELTQPWVIARYNVINRLKQFWSVNAPYKWFSEVDDNARLASGAITSDTYNDLKNMDIAYRSNLGSSFGKNEKVALQNSIINLENWENSTVAIHPCVWNLVEKNYESYIQLFTISLYGEEILKNIYSEAFNWNDDKVAKKGEYARKQDYERDTVSAEGLFSIEHWYGDKTTNANTDTDVSTTEKKDKFLHVHNVDYWKNYSHMLHPYTTMYEKSLNTNSTSDKTSRYIDFDGPFNYEMLKEVIDHYWAPALPQQYTWDSTAKPPQWKLSEEYKAYAGDPDHPDIPGYYPYSIRLLDLTKYYQFDIDL